MMISYDDWKEETWAAANHAADVAFKRAERLARPSWDRPGLQAVVDAAAGRFDAFLEERKLSCCMPWNLSTHGPWVGYRSRGRIFGNGREGMVSSAARFAGWIDKAREIPALSLFIRKTQSVFGVNSRATRADLWTVWKNNPSPHRAAHRFRAIQRRASVVLKSWGLLPSWDGIARAMETRLPVGKAAVHVAADTAYRYVAHRSNHPHFMVDWDGPGYRKSVELLSRMRGFREFLDLPDGMQAWVEEKVKNGEYESLREAAVAARDLLVLDERDGVECYLDPDDARTFHGVKVTRAYGHNTTFLVESGNRSYHVHRSWVNHREAVRIAIREWRRQEKATAAYRAEIEALLPKDRTVLIYKEDARGCGYCNPGIEAFMEKAGLAGRAFVPVNWLTDWVRHDHRVRVVVARVLKKENYCMA